MPNRYSNKRRCATTIPQEMRKTMEAIQLDDKPKRKPTKTKRSKLSPHYFRPNLDCANTFEQLVSTVVAIAGYLHLQDDLSGNHQLKPHQRKLHRQLQTVNGYFIPTFEPTKKALNMKPMPPNDVAQLLPNRNFEDPNHHPQGRTISTRSLQMHKESLMILLTGQGRTHKQINEHPAALVRNRIHNTSGTCIGALPSNLCEVGWCCGYGCAPTLRDVR